MTAIQHSDDHHVVALAGWMEADLAAAADRPLWSMSTKEAEEVLLSLTRARDQLEALLMRVLRQAQAVDAGLGTGATSTVNWWSHATRTTRAEAHRTARLAAALDDHEEVAQALASGDLRADQARVITDAVDDLPDTVEDWVPAAATQFLLGKAVEHDAKDLRVLGRRLLEAVDPQAADAEEARRLEAEEADARAAASLSMVDDGNGVCHGTFTVPSLHGAMLAKDLKARVLRDRKKKSSSDEEPMPTRHRLGLALLDYIESRPPDSVPSSGGVAATVVVTMELETLRDSLKSASLDTGGRISAGEARRLACRAGIIPVVLGGASVPLDVGRKRRFHTESQRTALGIRDGGCTAEGCDAPPSLTEAHHDEVPWSRGGGTSVEKGRLLCPPHHRKIHDPAFQHSLDKHGKVRFTRRT
ncbi:hypothetical protein GCM10011376_03900 [Nocardioides flavus (ex Wang et al. 2016)]|uniref:HNH nuclease domain-containing protein n=1 Tax=Nocardioides flavus (ex Wang et al. 2016) TaxID=2058780 RepID=A0ABQ3HIS3_9ACTN|nr:HNH endonuclease signature motif containing protein [Nocardioides flavus (ex Wang et al. 2016)]GHE15492.1 hypothetical protein GCM10011376_03900 [Nocardioides flavus (ex Wang et al. 2016)]